MGRLAHAMLENNPSNGSSELTDSSTTSVSTFTSIYKLREDNCLNKISFGIKPVGQRGDPMRRRQPTGHPGSEGGTIISGPHIEMSPKITEIAHNSQVV